MLTVQLLKAGHLISMVAWYAGLFYLFRLLVNWVEQREHPEIARVLAGMADRLYRIITRPAMIATLAFGAGMLALNPQYLSFRWLQIKLVLVGCLVGYHLYVGRVIRRFAAGDIYLTSRQCRLRNEIPTPLLVLIVLLAVLRPW
jgi:putative membrane protein